MPVFFDIDTQIDFLYPGGALYGRGGEHLISKVAALSHHAVRAGLPLISTTCKHGENAREFQVWPPHCVGGTVGQQKPPALLFANRYVVPNTPARVEARGAHQIIVEKDELDVFTNPNMTELLEQLDAGECFIYGAFTEYCVSCAMDGILKSGRRAWLVTDAIAALDASKGRQVVDSFVADGGRLTTMSEVLAAPPA